MSLTIGIRHWPRNLQFSGFLKRFDSFLSLIPPYKMPHHIPMHQISTWLAYLSSRICLTSFGVNFPEVASFPDVLPQTSAASSTLSRLSTDAICWKKKKQVSSLKHIIISRWCLKILTAGRGTNPGSVHGVFYIISTSSNRNCVGSLRQAIISWAICITQLSFRIIRTTFLSGFSRLA